GRVIGLFAPLRDKVTSSAQPLGLSAQPGIEPVTLPDDELAGPHSITSSAAIRGTKGYGTSRGHSGFAPENLTTLPHLSISSATSFPKSAGEAGMKVPTSDARRGLTGCS